MTATNAVEGRAGGGHELVTVKVNGKPVQVEHKTTVGSLLDIAGYDQANHYLVEVHNGKETKEYRDVTQKLSVSKNDEFRAYYTADTPVS
jgi:sulfur carrier protein ThiS